jgi:type II secretory pathway pseudopilin PulG
MNVRKQETGNRKQNFGFSLVEAVIVIALVVVLSIVVVNMFIGQNRIYKTQTAELGVNAGARNSLDDIDAFVRGSSTALGSYTTYTAGPQVLILQIQSIDVQNKLIAGTFDHVVYYLLGTDLIREIFPNAASTRSAGTKQLARNVNGLVFTYNNSNFSLVTEIDTDLTIEDNAGVQNRSITLSSKSRIRNK